MEHATYLKAKEALTANSGLSSRQLAAVIGSSQSSAARAKRLIESESDATQPVDPVLLRTVRSNEEDRLIGRFTIVAVKELPRGRGQRTDWVEVWFEASNGLRVSQVVPLLFPGYSVGDEVDVALRVAEYRHPGEFEEFEDDEEPESGPTQGMKVLRLNGFSNKVYGVKDDGSVVVGRSGADLCQIDGLDWQPVPGAKVPVTLKRWIEDQAQGHHR